ncbi:unnamed protein product [Prorocentrum cordatum]|uniref:Exo-alpha-sialidase n=1 Tax=Prorocentrum cordatum TaxID=2364126 RepID=A0ABN9SPP7_9DINO|nr:unnamed protein product [Polarella glacialis]
MEAAGLLAAPAPRRAGEAGAAARPGRRRDHGEGAVRGSAKGLQRARLRVMAVSAVACVAAVVLLGRTRFASPSVSNEGFAGLVRLTVDTGSWCSNYRDIQIGTSIVAPNEGLCRTHCNANADCEFFIFKARSDCGDSSFDDNVCLIVGKNCTMQNNACFDLHPKNDAALDYLIHRAPAASVPTSVDASSAVNFVEDHRERDTGCSNWEDIQADETAHVESRRDCSTRCVGANGCVAFNYRERDDCEGAPGSKGACVLLREGCKRVESPCFDLYPAPGAGASSSQGNWAPEGAPPAPPTTSVGASSAADLAPGRPERDVGCSNWMDIQAAVPTSVASQRECSEGCDSTEGCVAFNYVERVDCEGAGGSRGSCALFREGCQKAHSPCFDFYPRLGPEASLAKVDVFPNANLGVGCFRIPAVVRTPSGRLVAFAEARHGELCADSDAVEVAVAYSDDFGRQWSPTRLAIGSSEYRVNNPCPLVLGSGRIVVVLSTHDPEWDGHVASGTAVVSSDDGGETWSQPTSVSSQFGPASGGLPGPGAGLVLEVAPGRERLLVVTHGGGYRRGEVGDEWVSTDYITYSDDGGQTWTTQRKVFPGLDEGTLAHLGNGEVMLVMRHPDSERLGRAVARSKDFGLTWGEVGYDPKLPGLVCQGSLLQHGSSTYYSGPVFQSIPYQRQMITVLRSRDRGQTWPDSRHCCSTSSLSLVYDHEGATWM